MPRTLTASTCTFVGRRKRNEDALVASPELGLFAVVDGMGGYAGGALASAVAVEALADFFASTDADPEATWPFAHDRRLSMAENRVDAAVRLANRRIRDRRVGEVRDMGATLALIAVRPRGAVIGHLGDSRIYRLRRGAGATLEHLTVDHSLYEQLRAGGVDLPPLADFVHANVVTRALGPHEDERPELRSLEIAGGDRFLLCTDGLSGPLDDAAIAAILGAAPIDGAADRLVQAAYDAGSRDNITAVVVEVGEAV